MVRPKGRNTVPAPAPPPSASGGGAPPFGFPGPPELPIPEEEPPEDLTTLPPGLEDGMLVGMGPGGGAAASSSAAGWPFSPQGQESAAAVTPPAGAPPYVAVQSTTTQYEQHYYRALAHLQSGAGLPYDHFRGTVLGARGGGARGTAPVSDPAHNIQAAEILWEVPDPGQSTWFHPLPPPD